MGITFNTNAYAAKLVAQVGCAYAPYLVWYCYYFYVRYYYYYLVRYYQPTTNLVAKRACYL